MLKASKVHVYHVIHSYILMHTHTRLERCRLTLPWTASLLQPSCSSVQLCYYSETTGEAYMLSPWSLVVLANSANTLMARSAASWVNWPSSDVLAWRSLYITFQLAWWSSSFSYHMIMKNWSFGWLCLKLYDFQIRAETNCGNAGAPFRWLCLQDCAPNNCIVKAA